MQIYTKLERLEVIEKYLFAKAYRSIVSKLYSTKEPREALINHHAKVFLVR